MTKLAPASLSSVADTSPVCAPCEACVAILAAKRDAAPRECGGKPVEQWKGRADQDVHMLGRLTYRIGIGGDIRQPAVHFPVSRNELPQCVILPSVGNYLNRSWRRDMPHREAGWHPSRLIRFAQLLSPGRLAIEVAVWGK